VGAELVGAPNRREEALTDTPNKAWPLWHGLCVHAVPKIDTRKSNNPTIKMTSEDL